MPQYDSYELELRHGLTAVSSTRSAPATNDGFTRETGVLVGPDNARGAAPDGAAPLVTVGRQPTRTVFDVAAGMAGPVPPMRISPAPAKWARMVVLRLTLNVTFATPVLEVVAVLKVFHLPAGLLLEGDRLAGDRGGLPSDVTTSFDLAVTFLPLVFAFSEAVVVDWPTTWNVEGVPGISS